MKTLNEAVDYVYNYLIQYDTELKEILDKDALHDVMEEELLDAMEWVISEDDMKKWVQSNDENYLDNILAEKLQNYSLLLQEMSNDILNEYVLWKWEE